MLEIKLPELGDGIESGDVLEVLVSEGDVITKDQGVVELETDKATVEVPSSHAGTVTKIHVNQGDTIKIGAAMISIEAEASAPAKEDPKPAPAPPAPTPEPVAPKPEVEAAPQPEPAPAPTPVASPAPVQAAAAGPPAPSTSSNDDVAAGPAIRRFAREVGVDLSTVTGTGPSGRITRDDILGVVRKASEGGTFFINGI